MEVFYHTGSLTLKQNYRLNFSLTPGDTIILNGEFIYQACDDKMCIPYWDKFSKTIYIDDNNLTDNNSIVGGPLYAFPVPNTNLYSPLIIL